MEDKIEDLEKRTQSLEKNVLGHTISISLIGISLIIHLIAIIVK